MLETFFCLFLLFLQCCQALPVSLLTVLSVLNAPKGIHITPLQPNFVTFPLKKSRKHFPACFAALSRIFVCVVNSQSSNKDKFRVPISAVYPCHKLHYEQEKRALTRLLHGDSNFKNKEDICFTSICH